MAEVVTMTTRELDRLRIIRHVLERRLTWPQAAAQLALSVRQIGRLCARVRTEGHHGIGHRLRGRPSNHRLAPGLLAQAVAVVQRHYPDFGPTFANEKLRARHQLVLSTWTLRQGLIQAGVWRPHARPPVHRAWRPRRACLGELIQLDGSDHAWFEARAPRCGLLLYVDDATSRLLYGAFVASEATVPLLRTTHAYLERHGRPVAFYVDRDSIYRVNRQPTIEEQLQDPTPLTQFTRAMRELDIQVIPAYSPQAKGRVERSFGTHQDRLVKELRLAKMADREAATQFLLRHYLPAHNARYAVAAANPTNAHRPLLPQQHLPAILALQTVRTLDHDYTVRFQNRFFQVLPTQPVTVRPRDRILIESRIDASLHFRVRGRYLHVRPIAKPPARPTRLLVQRARAATPARGRYHPPVSHPFKAASYQAMRRRQALQRHKAQDPDRSMLSNL